MSSRKFWPIALAVSAAVACSVDVTTGTRVPPPTPPGAAVLLKDIVIEHLASPYYHLEYDASERVIAVAFGSGLTTYDVLYDGNRISEMRNNVFGNHDRLVYTYDSFGRVAAVRYVHANGATFGHLVFLYDGQRLVALQRDVLAAGGFVLDKQMLFSYYTDGNLREIDESRPAIIGVQQQTRTLDRFADYDDGINVDGFTLIHNDFFDHLVLLPQVQLQMANPRHETLLTQVDGGPFITVDVIYSYAYDGINRPLAKSGKVTVLDGPNAGQESQTGAVYSYY